MSTWKNKFFWIGVAAFFGLGASKVMEHEGDLAYMRAKVEMIEKKIDSIILYHKYGVEPKEWSDKELIRD